MLRNLAVPAHNAAAFAAAGVLPALRAACGALSGQAEVVLNTGRILSKLSLHDGCQELIAKDPEYAPLLVGGRSRESIMQSCTRNCWWERDDGPVAHG